MLKKIICKMQQNITLLASSSIFNESQQILHIILLRHKSFSNLGNVTRNLKINKYLD